MHGVLRNECVSGRAHVRGSGRGYQRESEGVYENEELERVFESAAGFEGGARPSAAWGAAHTARMAEAVLVAALGESAEDAGDTIEYIVGMLEDEDAEVEDLLEAMVPMLEEFELGDCEAVCERAIAAARGGAAGEAALKEKSEPKLLSGGGQSFADDAAKYDAAAAEAAAHRTDAHKVNDLFDGADAEAVGAMNTKDAEKAERMRLAISAEVEAETAAVESELSEAKRTAAKLRLADGAGELTSVACSHFSLPNPGGGANLLDDASFVLAPGHRYALIGRNGKGKSTLLRWLAARRVGNLPPSLSVHYVSQEVNMSAEQELQLPLDVVLAADVERVLLLAEEAELEAAGGAADPSRVMAVQERLTAIGAASASSRATKLLINLGFSEELQGRQMKDLSGGWRVRVALSAALFAAPDLLLLDEPTNHLSIAAVLWLSKELSTSAVWKERIVCVVSHDRTFLDDACGDVLHISGVARRLTQQRGTYSTWAARRSEQQKTWAKRLELRAVERAKLAEFAGHGFKYGGSSSQINMQQMKLKQIEKIDRETEDEAAELAALNEDAELPLKLQAGGRLRQPCAQLKNVGFGYPSMSAPLFTKAEFSVDGDSRIVFLGENGNGKTTLVKLITGELEPTIGTVTRDGGARIALVNQHHADQLNLEVTPLAFLIDEFPGDSYAHEQKLRGHLAQCGVGQELQRTPGKALSGGQRSRVALAAVSFAKPHLLIMDEPTNNLDLEAVEALADCVSSFDGGVILVSHDQFFVSKVANEVWHVGNGGVNRVESFAAYVKKSKADAEVAATA